MNLMRVMLKAVRRLEYLRIDPFFIALRVFIEKVLC